MRRILLLSICITASVIPGSGSVIYNNLTPDGQMGAASRTGVGAFEIESADDFIVATPATVQSASFDGLIIPGTGGSPSISQVVVEIYRVFPLDSTSPPSGNVLTRSNSPSDVAFDARDSSAGGLKFNSNVLSASFTVSNSVQPGGIHPKPNQTTGGGGPLTGQEVQFDVTFPKPITLPTDRYFFVPQVTLTNGATFYWLSASRPISGGGTTPINPDLQMWTRDAALDPDWSRVGTDIVGAGSFNGAFSLDGTLAPEPSSWVLLAAGLCLVLMGAKKKWTR